MRSHPLFHAAVVCLLLFTMPVACSAQKQISNPFVPGYFADPTIVQHDGTFYLYATIDPWGGDSLAFWESTDFIQWQRKPLNWPTKAQCKSPTSNDSRVWAPSVVKGTDGKFHMFVSVGSEVYAGVADKPGGPWRNVKADGSPFISTQKAINVHTIDAEAFVDSDGKAYLYWGSGWDWKDGRCYAGQLNAAMDSFVTKPIDITPPHYFEAPYMLKRNEVYYLTYSEGKCTDSTYKVQYATSKTPLGPWTLGTNSPVLTTNEANRVIGPGHHTILVYNGEYYIIYHRISNPGQKELLRELCIDPLNFDAAGNIQKIIPTNKGVKNFVR
jgi:beta-xylosidase